MFKPLITLAASLALLIPGLTQAANIYAKGTQAHEIVASIDAYLPANMATVIVIHDENERFESQIDRQSMARLGLTEHRFNTITQSAWTPPGDLVTAYVNAIELTRNSNGASVCFMQFKTRRAVDVALMHEAMHCRTHYLAEWIEFSREAAPFVLDREIIGYDNKVIDRKLVQIAIEEIHARIMSMIIMLDTGSTADMPFFKQYLNAPYPVNPGKNSIRYAMMKCGKIETCSSDPSDLMAHLAKDRIFMEHFISDVKDAYKTLNP